MLFLYEYGIIVMLSLAREIPEQKIVIKGAYNLLSALKNAGEED